jgi:galactarate dehydratase
MAAPLYIRMHAADNVAIVANDGGLPAGAAFADGLVLVDNVPQGHKVALVDLPEGRGDAPLQRGDRLCAEGIPAGSWVHERLLRMPDARELDDLPIATVQAPSPAAAGGLHLRGLPQRRRLGRHAQHPGHHADRAVRGRRDRLRGAAHQGRAAAAKYPNVDDVVALEHGYGCGVAIDAPDAIIPIRTLRNISLNPNFGGEVMVVSLGCEKLQPERLLPPGSIPIVDERGRSGHEAKPRSTWSACRTTRTSASCR